ncbi:hypothetical protein APR04_000105 [Promicromonospora umidemergens]|uniref:Uncharacterized protein n=1 Tax=Promicromonospora umidemergens TaxID=629679 RepID=A0ABP8X576_9MICO|nr:hypothetical protein [Promicromonospora umidemergens]MCP2281216.1 hypothetical protein [Promicromonospora umidemergens]
MIADASTLLDEVRRVFATTSSGRELGLLDARVNDSTLEVIFAGGSSDADGPYGARIPVPRDTDDPLWTVWDPTTGLEEWIMYAVVQKIAEEYLTAGADLGARTPGNRVIWLMLDE